MYDMDARRKRAQKTDVDDKIYIETEDEIRDPKKRGDVSVRDIFRNVPEAIALWVLPLDAREPYRVARRQLMVQRKRGR